MTASRRVSRAAASVVLFSQPIGEGRIGRSKDPVLPSAKQRTSESARALLGSAVKQ